MADFGDKDHLFRDKHDQVKNRVTFIALGAIFTVLCLTGVFGGLIYAVGDDLSHDNSGHSKDIPATPCTAPCGFTLVESIPQNLTFPAGSPSHPSTFSGIEKLLGMAQETIEIASFYWTLRGDDLPVKDPSDWEGEQLFNDLVFAGKTKGIKIRIVQSQSKTPVMDTKYLAENANAEVRSIDITRLLNSGILHTKLWLIDRKHFYLGSANLDWRSFTQVKELGSVVENCVCMGEDLGKIFDAYWYLAVPDSNIPSTWPNQYNTIYNSRNPMKVTFNTTSYNIFLSSSPPEFCPAGRSRDGDTIVEIIGEAEKFVNIAVMDYFPTTQFSHPRKYWPVIDDALRSAAFNNHVKVRLLASYWENTWDEMFLYLQSLQDLNYSTKYLQVDVEVRMFIVPNYTDAQAKIPFARVNHNKYMVTDKTAYIGTSNWSGDYFVSTAGIGLIVRKGDSDEEAHQTVKDEPDIRQQLEDVFNRDWNSEYSYNLSHFNRTKNIR